MLDRIDTGQDRVASGLIAVAVTGDLLAQPVGFVAEGGHLLQGELRGVDLVGQRKDAARGTELDHVGAIFDLIANRLAEPIGAAGDSLVFVALGKQDRAGARCDRHGRRSAPSE